MARHLRNSRIEIITIGREILDGRVIDTNSVFLAQTLKSRGLVVRWAQRVDDEIARIVEAFKIAATRSDFVLVTGGLGPTGDDLTAEAAAEFLGEDLSLHAPALEQISQYFARIGREMLDVQKKQALLPRSAKILSNPVGTAPGFSIEKNGCRFFFMPGVPKEMKPMFSTLVLPQLPPNADYTGYQWATQFTSEGELQKRLSSVHKKLPKGFEITYRTRFPENHIGLFANTVTAEEKNQFSQLQNEMSQLLGRDVFSSGAELKSLEECVIDILVRKNIFVVTVESCTGGLVYNRLTNVSGSSQVVAGSYGCYANEMKIDLGVNPKSIERFGAVSKECALELAESGLKKFQSVFKNQRAVCVSTTGIAGPSGGSPEKPVGLCHLAVASSFTDPVHFELCGRSGLERTDYKNLFSQKALDLLRLYCESN